MEETTGRSLYSFSAVCCFLAGAFLPLPGVGQNLSSTPSSTVSHFIFPHTEAGSFSNRKVAPTVTSVDGNATFASQLNASSSVPHEPLAPTTHGSLYTTARLQNTTLVTNSSGDDRSLPTPAANVVEVNQTSLDYSEPINTTSWVISSTVVMGTEPSKSKDTRGPTVTSQPESSTLTTLEPTKRRPETMSVTDHEAIAVENSSESTSAPNMTDTDRRALALNASSTTTLTPVVVSSTRTSHTLLETKQPANHVQKTSVVDVGEAGEDLPSMPEVNPVGEDPLVIAVIFIFVVTVGILALMGFLRYRQRNGRLQFRRLQDLPMDDMMEDTPLSLYSY
ncbi:mucin-5AC-like isoform X2 [Rhineura floridana]|uniref:mucin-5AC-like isoform X2 n=1 Tax=Rhineura floridana TaxID=261503 RepID=UPI002AC84865|nr:mucin-5AC-like isoform X2 [Rhineura floridana]